MEITFIVNGLGFSSGMPIGGADKRALEMAKYWRSEGVRTVFVTTDAGEEILRKWGLATEFLTVKHPSFWPKFLENNLLGRVLAYFYVILADFFSSFPLPTSHFQLIYPTSDMFFDLLPAVCLKWRQKKAKLVGIVHHDIPPPFKRPGNPFFNLLLFLSQQVGFLLLKFFADLVLYPRTPEGESIKKSLQGYRVNKDKLADFCNGVNLTEINATPYQEKKYTACFLGSLRPSKGIFDLVPLWREVRRQLPAANLLVIGGGLARYQKELEGKIREAGLERAVILAGVIPQPELYSSLKACRAILSPSYEEGWGIALLEGLACGLPAVAYDLPAYRPFGAAVRRVEVGDWQVLAAELVKLLREPEFYRKQVSLGQALVQEYDWGKLAASELNILRNLGKND